MVEARFTLLLARFLLVISSKSWKNVLLKMESKIWRDVVAASISDNNIGFLVGSLTMLPINYEIEGVRNTSKLPIIIEQPSRQVLKDISLLRKRIRYITACCCKRNGWVTLWSRGFHRERSTRSSFAPFLESMPTKSQREFSCQQFFLSM
jgi:hypothetical protein